MDDNLAVVYEDMLELGLVNEELAKCLSNILFAHKLYYAAAYAFVRLYTRSR